MSTAICTLPGNGNYIDPTVANIFAWDFTPIPWQEYQAKYQVYYKETGAGAWSDTGLQTSTNKYHSFAGATFSASKEYQWYVVCTDQWDGLATSPVVFFNTGTTPALPAITDPTDGATITAATYDFDWTPDSGNQDYYQIQRLTDEPYSDWATDGDATEVDPTTESGTESFAFPYGRVFSADSVLTIPFSLDAEAGSIAAIFNPTVDGDSGTAEKWLELQTSGSAEVIGIGKTAGDTVQVDYTDGVDSVNASEDCSALNANDDYAVVVRWQEHDNDIYIDLNGSESSTATTNVQGLAVTKLVMNPDGDGDFRCRALIISAAYQDSDWVDDVQAAGSDLYRLWELMDVGDIIVPMFADGQAFIKVDDPTDDGADAYEDTGAQAYPSAVTHTLTMDANTRKELWRMRVKYNGLWSDWVGHWVFINWVPPDTPSVTVTASSANGYITCKTDHGGDNNPAVSYFEVWRTEDSTDTDDAIRLEDSQADGATYTDYNVAVGPVYRYFGRAYTATGEWADSALTA